MSVDSFTNLRYGSIKAKIIHNESDEKFFLFLKLYGHIQNTSFYIFLLLLHNSKLIPLYNHKNVETVETFLGQKNTEVFQPTWYMFFSVKYHCRLYYLVKIFVFYIQICYELTTSSVARQKAVHPRIMKNLTMRFA